MRAQSTQGGKKSQACCRHHCSCLLSMCSLKYHYTDYISHVILLIKNISKSKRAAIHKLENAKEGKTAIDRFGTLHINIWVQYLRHLEVRDRTQYGYICVRLSHGFLCSGDDWTANAKEHSCYTELTLQGWLFYGSSLERVHFVIDHFKQFYIDIWRTLFTNPLKTNGYFCFNTIIK